MHRSLSIELDLSSPTKRFSLAGLGFHSGNLSLSPASRALFLARAYTSPALEGRRFIGWQFYRMAAGCSRNRPGDWNFPLTYRFSFPQDSLWPRR
jgi:hypothetical protein